MSSPRYRLNKFLKDIKKRGELPAAAVIKLMSDTRQLLEVNKSKESYSHLNLYCNWCLHPNISSSVVGFRILEKMTDAILVGIEKKEKPISVDANPTEYFISVAGDMFSVDRLREEFIILYKDADLPAFLFEIDENWIAIMSVIFEELLDKPIQFPDGIEKSAEFLIGSKKKARAIYERMSQNVQGNPEYITNKIWISKREEAFPGKFCWNIETFSPLTFVGEISPPKKLARGNT